MPSTNTSSISLLYRSLIALLTNDPSSCIKKGAFDSMMLVVLIAEIEEELMNNFDIEVSLTSDKAMAKATPYESNLKILNLIEELS